MTIEKSEKFVLLYPYCNRFLFIHYISILFYLIVYLFDGILFSLALIYSQETGRDILILYKLNLQIWRWAWDRSKCNQLSLRAHSRDFACSRVFNDRELRTFWYQAVLFRDSLSWFCRLYSRNLARSWRLTLVQFLPSRRIGSRSQLVCELTSYLQWWLFSGTTSDYLGYFTVPNPLCSKDFFFSQKLHWGCHAFNPNWSDEINHLWEESQVDAWVLLGGSQVLFPHNSLKPRQCDYVATALGLCFSFRIVSCSRGRWNDMKYRDPKAFLI